MEKTLTRMGAGLFASCFALASCQTAGGQTASTKSEAGVSAFDTATCQGFRAYAMDEMREALSEDERQEESDRVTRILADVHIPDIAKDADTLILAWQGSRPVVHTTIWYDAEAGEWRGYKKQFGTAWGPVPPPPPPPPPPEDATAEQLAEIAERKAKEQARKEAAERAEEELRREGYVYTTQGTAIIEAWMKDPCFAAEMEFLPHPVTLRSGEGWICPSDGNYWVGEIRKKGETVRQMSVPCGTKTATHGFLEWATR